MALTSTTKAYSTITFSSGVSTNLSYDVGSIDYNPDIGDSLEVYADDTKLTSGYTINTTSKKIELNEITSNPPTNIIIKRIANKTSRQIDFQNASVLTEADLDNSALQTFHVAQEAIDKANDALPKNTAGTEWNASISSNTAKITNVATPSAGTDAVNKTYADTVNDSVGAHRDDALDHRDTAEDYAVRTGAVVRHFDGATDNTSDPSPSDQDGVFSAKEHAVGTTVTTGSAKSWASADGSAQVAYTDYSAKAWASDDSNDIGSAKDWASKATTVVNSTAFYSAKEYASGDAEGSGGSAKAWATDTSSPDGTSAKSAKTWAGEAAASAASAATAFDSFDDRYLGTKSSNPTQDNDGNALVTGALYFNTSDGEMRVYDGSSWISASAAQQATIFEYVYDITGSVTNIVGASGSGFAENDSNPVQFGSTESVHVYLNGVQLVEGASDDYQLTPASNTVTFNSALASGDIVKIVVYKTFTVGDAVPASTGGTFSGNVAVTGNVSATGNIQVDDIVEKTSAHGVEIDGVLIKDGDVGVATISSKAGTSVGVTLGTDSGDDFNVGSGKLVVEGDTGNVGIGTPSPDQTLVVKTADGGGIAIENSAGDQYRWAVNSDNSFAVIDTGTAERMRIDGSGNLMINTTSTSVGTLTSGYITIDLSAATKHGLNINSLAQNYAAIGIRKHNTSGTSYPMFIINSSNALVGSISMTNSAVAFNTSSDYRLKEDWQPMTGSIDRLKALNPVNFAWKVDGNRVDGFLAHEAQAVVPEAVTGEKDAVDKDGNPQYQGIDQAKLVPLLTAALQEAVSKIEALTARIKVLENA